MDFGHSPKTRQYIERVSGFMTSHVLPREREYITALRGQEDRWASIPSVIDELKAKARTAGLWNLFLPDTTHGAGLTNTEYAPLAELMGRSLIAPEIFNCNAPDTGNAEVLLHYGSDEQRLRWMEPLLRGEIRSAFCMTEPDVASSDAANMAATATVDGDSIVLNGRKWWSTGIGHPDCRFAIFMGLTYPEAPRHARHSMVLVPLDTPGVRIERMLPVYGYLDEPYGHGEVSFCDVRLPLESVIAGPGRGFEIAQGRLGPGRIHHCMRLIGLAENALELACRRAVSRTAFGKPLSSLGGNRERIAKARIAINQARLQVLHAAWLLDTVGAAGAISELSQVKAAVPAMACDVIDMAIQLHGGAGLSDDFPLASSMAAARALRLADGPDEVHLGVIARAELGQYRTRGAA
ncbi:acyl-CoA dehydrogenase (plasmid) [Streptomyces sp. WAC00288]|uniref:acyl-CoA dehydrogenase family protein n=1 Tax=unclassified Streptomyces TaxID=2593676 RepID=UPI00078821F5|nr:MULTISPECIES: acyl-CoA dehydrogenase family protein [unclassified Streptomyces]AVI00197.1 acyl-CoA dehydrogenase [Streptomyces sp. WAC00288]KYG51084.1 acyl-CoA dehydrogenase [Streptomyces sp. WAC04657]